MSDLIKDITYYNKINCHFSELLYQQMATIRYGITFCCEPASKHILITKELLDLNNIMDKKYTVPIA